MRDSQHLACVILQPKGIKLPKFTLDRSAFLSASRTSPGRRTSNWVPMYLISDSTSKGKTKRLYARSSLRAVWPFSKPSSLPREQRQALLIFHKERAASVSEFKLMVNFAREFSDRIGAKSE